MRWNKDKGPCLKYVSEGHCPETAQIRHGNHHNGFIAYKRYATKDAAKRVKLDSPYALCITCQ